MHQLTGSIVKYPARASFGWYSALILLGAFVLRSPVCHGDPERGVSFLDALFTSTSAACVTGLAVRSTEHDFSFFGQVVILALIQLGGIGIMTVTTFFVFRFGGRQGLRARLVLAETLGADGKTNLGWILSHVIRLTLLIEGAGFIVLFLRNLVDQPVLPAAWHALFHSVSAFCNAGFALHDDSLSGYAGDVVVNVVIGVLIVLGGIGFPIILDVMRNWKLPFREWWDHYTLHTKLMLIGTTSLLVLGCVAFLILEWDGILAPLPLWQRPIVAMFHSISCRTAGFNTVEIGELTNAMLFVSIILMAIGAGPCSTAGGFKVSTIMVLVLQAWATFRGKTSLNLFRRTIPQATVDRAIATAMLFGVVAIVALTSLLVIEQSGKIEESTRAEFLEGLFEVVSALGTVGLSTGITSKLGVVGRLILILLMFLGRLGPISVFVALSRGAATSPIMYPDEEPMVG
ncbi:MAG: potassium transporter TrkG [Pirellulaceae bacterium]|nr:hypothetical protein [Planctomycetales bacterium]